MKKLLSVLLALTFAFGCFSLCAFAAEEPMKVLVTSDVHWQKVDSVSPDGFFRPRDSLGQVTAITPQIVRAFLKDAAASDADYVFMTGDLTNMGSPDAAAALAGILAEFEDSTGKQVFVIDGNHDVEMEAEIAAYDMTPQMFRETYRRFGYDEALAVDEKTASYTADLKNGYRLLAVDSNKWEGAGSGEISEELLAWIEAQVADAKRDGKKIVAMMHHQLMEHYTMEEKVDDFYILKNHKDVCKRFAAWDIRVTFTGHLHMGDIASYTGGGNTIYDVTTAALSCYPLTYREVTFTDEAISLQSREIASLDISDLAAGYSEAQRDMIANDPVGYAYGCMQDSFIDEYVKNFVDADYLIDLMGLEEGSALAGIIKRILPEVLIPLYGEGNTVEAKAKQLGYSLTPSDYETVADLLAAFWAAFTRGDENLGGNSTEGRLVLESVYALLASKAGQESGALAPLVVNPVTGRLGLMGIDNVLTRAALDKLLVGLFVDKGPADNDVTLPGYEAKTASGVFGKLSAFFETLLSFFRNLFPAGKTTAC